MAEVCAGILTGDVPSALLPGRPSPGANSDNDKANSYSFAINRSITLQQTAQDSPAQAAEAGSQSSPPRQTGLSGANQAAWHRWEVQGMEDRLPKDMVWRGGSPWSVVERNVEWAARGLGLPKVAKGLDEILDECRAGGETKRFPLGRTTAQALIDQMVIAACQQLRDAVRQPGVHEEARPSSMTRYPLKLVHVSTGAVVENEGHKYATLSYVWDEWKDRVQLMSQIRDTMEKTGLLYVWIDALCIDQNDPAAKARELPAMGDYYRNAELNVIVVREALGEEILLKKIDWFGTGKGANARYGLHQAARVGWKVAEALKATRWATRVWTMQEGLLGKRHIIAFADQRIVGELVELGQLYDPRKHKRTGIRFTNWALNSMRSPKTFEGYCGLGTAEAILNLSTSEMAQMQMRVRRQPWTRAVPLLASQRTQGYQELRQWATYDWLMQSSTRNASVPVDHVYGILGMCRGGTEVDAASKSLEEAMRQLVLHCRVDARILMNKPSTETGFCWAPNWAQAQIGNITGLTRLQPLITTTHRARGENARQSTFFYFGVAEASQEEKAITVRGVRLGRLTWSGGQVILEDDLVIKPARGYESLWKEQMERARLTANTAVIYALHVGQITVSRGRTAGMVIIIQLQGDTAHKIGHVIIRPLRLTKPEVDVTLGRKLT